MADKLQTFAVPVQSARATFAPSSVNAEKRTVDVIWTTGARVMRGYYDRFLEELSLDPKHVRMGRLNNGAPFLDEHNGSTRSTFGVVESAKLEGDKGTATIRFIRAGVIPEADQLFEQIRDGIVQNVSVGYRVHKLEKIEETSDKVPVYRATDWEPFEISAVAMGADDGAGFRSASPFNDCTFITRGEPHTEQSNMDETEKAAAELAAMKETEKRDAELKAAEARAAQVERERAAGIRNAVRVARLDDAFAEKLVTDGVALDKAREAVLNEMARKSDEIETEPHVRYEAGEGAFEKMKRGVSAWLIERSGSASAVAKAFPKADLDGGEFRGMSLMDLGKAVLDRARISYRGKNPQEIAKLALSHRSGGMQSTSDFAVFFEDALNKTLLADYRLAGDVWSLFCGQRDVPDFRAAPFYRSGSMGNLEQVAEGGEFTHMAVADGEKSTIQAYTWGKIVSLTRQALINDDMSALSDIASKMGRSARRAIELEVFRQLLLNSGLGPTQADSQPFFHANRANVNASASGNTAAGWAADRNVMATQLDINAIDYLDLRPSILLVPLAKQDECMVLNTAQFNPLDNRFEEPNPVRSMFSSVISTPRLSGTRRYLFAGPSDPAVIVAFLAGTGRAPTTESEQGFEVDGVMYKIRLDFGVNFFDGKAAVTNAGV